MDELKRFTTAPRYLIQALITQDLRLKSKASLVSNSAARVFICARADFFIMIDGDDAYPPERITDSCDFCASTTSPSARVQGFYRGRNYDANEPIWDSRQLTAAACTIFKKEVTDLCTGFWGYQRHVTNRMNLTATGFEIEAAMFVECVRLGFNIGEVAIEYNKRTEQPKLSSIRDGLKIGFFLLKQRMNLNGGREP